MPELGPVDQRKVMLSSQKQQEGPAGFHTRERHGQMGILEEQRGEEETFQWSLEQPPWPG